MKWIAAHRVNWIKKLIIKTSNYKIITVEMLSEERSIEFPRVNPMLGPLERWIVLFNLILGFRGSLNLT